MLANSKEIWDDNGYGKDNPFENTISFLIKEAKARDIDDGVAEAIVAEVLLEVVNGKVFPKDKCPCGCGIDKSGTAITHEMLNRIVKLGEKVKADKAKIIVDNLNAIIINHIKNQNEQYIKEKVPPKKPFFDWSLSPTVKGAKWLYGLVRSSK